MTAVIGAIVLWPRGASAAWQGAGDVQVPSAAPPVDPVGAAERTIGSQPWFWGNVIGAALVLLVLWGKGILRRRGLKCGRDVDSQPWWVWMACAAITWLILQVGLAIAGQAVNIDPKAPRVTDQAMVTAAGYTVGLMCAVVLVRLMMMAAPRSGLGVSPRMVLFGLVCGVLAWPIVTCAGFAATALHEQLSGKQFDPVGHPTLKALLEHPGDPWVWVMVAVAVLAAPVIEEIIYRGFVQSLILRATGHPWIAIVGASMIFGAAHVGWGIPWYSVVPITVLGMSMGLAFERTRSLGVPIGMHVLFNGANVAMALVIGG